MNEKKGSEGIRVSESPLSSSQQPHCSLAAYVWCRPVKRDDQPVVWCGVDAGSAAQTAWQTPAQYNVTGAATAPAAAARIGGVTCVLLLLHNTFHNVQNSANTD